MTRQKIFAVLKQIQNYYSYENFWHRSFIFTVSGSSRPEVFCKKGVFRNFTKFTGKHLCQRSKACNFIKNRLRFSCFPLNFAKFLKTPFLQNTFGGCFCVSLSEFLIAAISNNILMDFLQKLQEKGHCFNCLRF